MPKATTLRSSRFWRFFTFFRYEKQFFTFDYTGDAALRGM